MKTLLHNLNFLRLRVMLLPLLLVVAGVGEGAENKAEIQGYNCLLMGHSFFAPVAKEFAVHAARYGVRGHKQTVVFHGGGRGAPGMLWNDAGDDVAMARKLLQTGTVDLVGLTFFYTGSEVADYRRWVDLALKYNPHTRFMIQAPWPIYQKKSIAQYEADEEAVLTSVHQRIDQLRKLYPGTVFLCVPQGRWMVGLWRLYDQGELPEVAGVMKGDPRYLFRDELGHGGKLPVEAGALLWLAVIYQADLRTYAWDTHTVTDLKKLAQEICEKDPYCGLKPATETTAGDGK